MTSQIVASPVSAFQPLDGTVDSSPIYLHGVTVNGKLFHALVSLDVSECPCASTSARRLNASAKATSAVERDD